MNYVNKYLAIGVSFYHLYFVVAGVYEPYIYRVGHLSLFLLLFYIQSIDKNDSRFKWIDLIPAFLSIATVVFVILEQKRLLERIYMSSPVTNADLFFGISLIIILLIAAWSRMGKILPIVSILFVSYIFLGPYMPGIFWHRGLSIVEQ